MSSALSAASPQSELQLPEADRYFFALDGRAIGPYGWTAQVLGIHGDPHGWWIQVGRAGNPALSVVLRAPVDVTVERLLAALAAWQPVNADLDVKYVR